MDMIVCLAALTHEAKNEAHSKNAANAVDKCTIYSKTIMREYTVFLKILVAWQPLVKTLNKHTVTEVIQQALKRKSKVMTDFFQGENILVIFYYECK